MTWRFASNLTVLLLGAFLAAVSHLFPAAATGWLALGVAAAVVLAELAAFALPGRGTVQRGFDVVITGLAAWSVVASRAFSGATMKWLSFAGGAGLCALAALALIAHEAAAERAEPPRAWRVTDGRAPLATGEPISTAPR